MGSSLSAQSPNTTCQANVTKPVPSDSRIKAFHTKDQWKTWINSRDDPNKLVVINFTAKWCGPCKSMEPVLREFSEKYTDIDIVKIDVDELPHVATEFGVQALPAFLLMKRGEEVDKVVGARKEELQKKIEQHRNSY